MEWTTFIVEMTKAISGFAWPAVVVFLIFRHRKEVSTLLSRIEKVTLPGGVAEFAKVIEELNDEADRAGLPPVPIIEPERDLNDLPPAPAARFALLADASPRAAVLDAWIDVELALKALAERHGIQSSKNLHLLVRGLHVGEILEDADIELFFNLYHLRNQAAHGQNAETFTPSLAQQFREVALRLRADFDRRA